MENKDPASDKKLEEVSSPPETSKESIQGKENELGGDVVKGLI